jgi:hypothetical protein
VALVGSGFVLGTPRGWVLRCRFTSACPTSGHTCTSFTHEGYSGGALYANATVLNDTHATCVAPIVAAPGPGLLSICLSRGVWLCNGAPAAMRVSYFALVEAVLGRRPYLDEARGELLVTAHPSLAGQPLQIEASLGFASPAKRWTWMLTPTPAALVAALPLELTGLPETINADLRIDVSGLGAAAAGISKLTIWRRLMRAPLPASASAAAAAVQVDHSARMLRVGGVIFQGSGWYFSVPSWPPSRWHSCTQALIINSTACTALWVATIRPRSALGTLSMMTPNGLGNLQPMAQLAFLDACETLGVKVMYPMVQLGLAAVGGMNYDIDWASPVWRADVVSNVSLVQNHTAILGFYICDDCCPRNVNIGNVSKQAKLYNLIKSLAPTKL